jgi:hypothetical protein
MLSHPAAGVGQAEGFREVSGKNASEIPPRCSSVLRRIRGQGGTHPSRET